jgi:hypothetical protein
MEDRRWKIENRRKVEEYGGEEILKTNGIENEAVNRTLLCRLTWK